MLCAVDRVLWRRPPRLQRDAYLGSQRIFRDNVHVRAPTLLPRELHRRRHPRWRLLQCGARNGVRLTCALLHARSSARADRWRVSWRGCETGAWRRSVSKPGYAHRRVYGERFWQDGYFDRHLRREEVTLDIVSYIVCNPVRAGLCVSVEDYPWSGSSVYPLREILQDVRWRPRSLG